MLTGLLEHVVKSSEVALSPGSWKESSLTIGSWKESRLLAMLEASSKVVEYNEEREDGLVVDDEVELISSCCCCCCCCSLDPRETFFNRKSAKEVAVSPWQGAAIGAESGDFLGAQSGDIFGVGSSVDTGAGGGRAKLCGEAAIWSFFDGACNCVPFSTNKCLLKIKV